MADPIRSLRGAGATPAPRKTSDSPIPLGDFHSVTIDHEKRTVSFRSSAPSGNSAETLEAMREGKDGCERLASFWTAQGYKINGAAT